ncbi:peptidase-like protein [Xylariomycetidae sp. FL2044]|nr:peptidase-like protein [Xylariomycetidae sp. FL2044]
MPSEKSHYVPAPPIPTYDEAVGGSNPSSSNPDWPPPRSPIDTRPDHETEAQSLLFSRDRHPNASRPAPNGYRPPYIESDDEGSQWTLEDDDDSDDDENAQVRRDMQELEVEDPLNGSSSSRSSSSSWRKRLAFSLPSLPQWRWRWRLPRLTVRLPRQNEITDDEEAQSSEPRSRWTLPKMNGPALLLLFGRLLAVFLVLGFLYLLFVSDLFSSMSRRLGGQMFNPEAVRVFTQNSVDSQRMADTLKHFTNYAHIAGTEGDYALAMDVRNGFVRNGLEDVTVDEYFVYMNYAKQGGRSIEVMSEDGNKAVWTAALEELDMGGETAGHQTYVFHGLSKAGDVRGPLIYANTGSREDFKKLVDNGIDTQGSIAIMRYAGRQTHPGLQVKAAEEAGFLGCILYSDPADSGFLSGTVAPDGRYMPADGVRRDTVSLPNWVIGDVLTPGWESKKGLPRMKPDKSGGLVQIPSLPIAWRDAQELLHRIQGFGDACSEDWRGGVKDFEWWTGNSSSPVVRLKNEQDEPEQQEIWNIYGEVVGIEQSEKSIIIGNHRDSWTFGASDPNSGSAVMLEVSRIFGDLMARGWRPLRTIKFMSWDAAEYNMIGSTEYVEQNLETLQKHAFAYINLDGAVSGGQFHAAASPMFRKVLHRVLDRVVDPMFNTTLRDLWDGRQAELEGLGLGSDYVAFQDMAGTSSIDISFQGPGHPYHSSYDNFDWMQRVGDYGFVYHNLLAQVLALLILELAEKPILPFDMGNYAAALRRYLSELWQWAEDRGAIGGDSPKVNMHPLEDAVKEIETSIAQFEQWEPYWEQAVVASNGWEPNGLGDKRIDYNSRMALFESALLDLDFGGGIPNRTQFKHVVFGPQKWSGYDPVYFPAIRDAIEDEDWDLAQQLVDKTSAIMAKAAESLIDMREG